MFDKNWLASDNVLVRYLNVMRCVTMLLSPSFHYSLMCVCCVLFRCVCVCLWSILCSMGPAAGIKLHDDSAYKHVKLCVIKPKRILPSVGKTACVKPRRLRPSKRHHHSITCQTLISINGIVYSRNPPL